MSWSPSQIPSLSSKTILITGANTGIGFHTARYFCKHGAQVILACRSEDKMATAAAEISKEFPSARIVQMQLDLSNIENVYAFAEKFKHSGIEKIDVLALNAGVAMTQFRKSKQGLELMFATNHIGHWLLTGLLIDYIKDVDDSRIVVVSSLGHRQASGVNYDVAQGKTEQGFVAVPTYCDTKLANQWFTRVLQHKLEDARAKTIAVNAHPGGSSTNLVQNINEHTGILIKMWMNFITSFQQSAEQGSWPTVFAATDPDIKKENYYGPSGWFELRGPPKPNCTRNSVVFDIEKARELWRISEDITGFRYTI